MIKIDLITGFLGSGKTTFIKKYAEYLLKKGEKIGILENDFGAVNVDMMLNSILQTIQLKRFPSSWLITSSAVQSQLSMKDQAFHR